jgi:single-stranded-DNA-specific exonuclease
MKPIFTLTDQKLSGYVKTMGKDNNHLKFYIRQESSGRNIECVGFKLGQFVEDFKNKTSIWLLLLKKIIGKAM